MTDGAHGTDGATYAWAPPEPAKRKNRSGLWIGIPAGATAVALIAASLVLIAPGASVAGVQIGGLTAGAAAQAISSRLAQTTVQVESPAGEVTVTGADLGATVDAAALADKAFADNPMWKPSSWFPQGTGVAIQVNAAAAATALRERAPGTYRAPVDATVAYDAASQTYVTTAAEAGEGIDVAAVTAALQSAFDAGKTSTTVDAELVPVEAPVSTEEADAAVATLNGILDSAGFYVGDERTVAVDRATAASWLTVTPDGKGDFAISADAAAIQKAVDGLAGSVNRAAVNADVIVDTGGEVIKTLTEGKTGRALGDTAGVADAFARQLAEGNGKFALAVTETPFETTKTERRIEVNLSTQTTTLWQNGQVYRTYTISSGAGDHATHTGEFRIGWKTAMQDMGCVPGYDYCTKDVPWVAYFNGDEGFHGTYWHNNFGTPMSHGCINMTISAAKELYDWAYRGTQVSVHY
ncbi:L,D-transpeptidase family protein [Microbacterium trichothecenolyticum]|uniref:Lipoprotein-anchoring transpeptidase ErfK/SrfK n=1 Tax=Microbacterium trichothecenolyticum TaxID=69370 RepID=A0ABU0TUA2_MICTR|nr:L,D-transpeptidase [Microbacterium trichothecenolyticum]MDQ1123060.1 lipoprotein-anchoring transpeptidase ErfK/SrfK [Microbacterium trichothecenolyticum]